MGLEQIAFLSHFTTAAAFRSILARGKLLTAYDRWKRGISNSVATLPQASSKQFEIGDEFPGVFMSWHLGGESFDRMFAPVVLVFPRDLIRRQKNFHLNLCDKNGFFIEHGTFFFDDPVPDLAAGRSDMNEVAFHDSVPIKLCRTAYCRDADTFRHVSSFAPKWLKVAKMPKRFPLRPAVLPRELLPLLDTGSPPCRVFLTDINYTGIECEAKHPARVASVSYVREIAVRAGYERSRVAKMKSKDIEAMMRRDGAYLRCFLTKNAV